MAFEPVTKEKIYLRKKLEMIPVIAKSIRFKVY